MDVIALTHTIRNSEATANTASETDARSCMVKALSDLLF